MGLNMTKYVHEMQIRGIDNWFDLVKFLLPIFVTVFTAGLTMSFPNFNQFVLILLGSLASLIILGVMLRLSCVRGRIINNQVKDLEKIRDIFDDCWKMFEFQNEVGLKSSELSKEQINNLSKEMLEMMEKYNQKECI